MEENRAVKVGLISLGCAKNLVDSEVMLGLLHQAGYKIVGGADGADVLVVNTCAFIEDARKESLEAIEELRLQKSGGNCRALIVTGCLPQRYYGEIKDIMEVDAFLGVGEFPKIVEVVERVLGGEKLVLIGEPEYVYGHLTPRLRATPLWTAYVKVAEGCDNHCSYCTIAEIRGRFRSRPVESVVREVEMLAGQGVREINLIAQDTTRYGLDLYGEYKLVDLLKELVRVEPVKWIRLLYCYPTRVSTELIQLMASEDRICKYIDLPIQHVAGHILKAMNREGNAEEYLELIEAIRGAIPQITLRTTVMVGFPGETADDFGELLDFVMRVQFDRLGGFVYSPETGTVAAGLKNQVAKEVAAQRLDELMRLQRVVSLRKNERLIGKTLDVLVEGKSDDGKFLIGRSERDAPEIDGLVYVDAKGKEWGGGEFAKVEITDCKEYDLIGGIVAD